MINHITDKRKRITSLLLALVMVFTMIPLTPLSAFAADTVDAENAVASVTINGTTTYYETLAEAATAAQTGTEDAPATLKLEQSIDLGTSCLTTTTGVFTFDLNGKTLSSSKDRDGTLAIEGGIVTITDTVGGGTITNSTYYGVAAFYGCTVTINGGTISGEIHGVYIENATVTINGGIITGTDTEEGAGVYINTWVGYTSSVTINGGTITGAYCDLYNSMDSTIILGLGEDGVGATFPGGLSIVNGEDSSNTLTLDTILGENAAYWQGDKMIFLTEEQMEITSSDVTVKKECKHENATYPTEYITETQHKITCSCGYEVTENHTPEYSVNDATITCSCTVCENDLGTATISAESKTYDGEAVTATVNGTGALTDTSVIVITYAVKDGEPLGSEAPSDVGTYTASFTLGAETASLEFTINSKRLMVKAHDVSKTYGDTDPALTYTFDGLVNGDELIGALSRVKGENVGTYDITQGDLTAGDNYEIDFTGAVFSITKATPTVTVPTANTLTYNGEEQKLVSAGSTIGGTLYYALSDNGDNAPENGWTTDIPTAKNAGTYYVWYKVVEDDNYTDATYPAITVTISAKSITPTIEGLDDVYAYTGKAIEPVVTVKYGDTTLVKDTDYDVTYSNNTDIGTATVIVTFKGNYSGTATETFEIICEHKNYTNGFCDVCDAYQPATQNSDGIYEIKNAGQLFWFAELVNNGTYDASAILTADINMDTFYWKAMGRTSDTAYTGTFDGKGFRIKNLNQNNGQDEGSRESFVYYLGAGGCIKNVTFEAPTVFCQGHANANASAVVSLRSSGTISNCIVTGGTVQLGNYAYLAGLVGVNESGGVIENCAVINTALTRRFSHSHSRAAIVHLNNGTVRNCYAYGCTYNNDNDANGGIIVSGNAPENCYYYTTSTVATTYGTAMTEEQFASGEVTWLLNGSTSEGDLTWFQTCGEGLPAFSGKTVYEIPDCQENAVGYYNTNDAVTHAYGTPTFGWSADNTACRAVFTCSVNSEHKEMVDCSVSVDTTDPAKTVYTASVTKYGVTYTDSKEVENAVASVTITWTEMSFTYNKGTWNTDTLTWDGGGWVADEGSGTVTVKNTGTVDVTAEFTATITDNTLGVSVNFTENEVALTDNKVTIPAGEEKTVSVTLTGDEPTVYIEEKKTIGQITIKLSE